MTMMLDGLAKLVEECGELSQIAAKKMAFMNSDEHPDGKGSLKARLEEELADVQAASLFVREQFGLDRQRISDRVSSKLKLFRYWHDDFDNQ